MGILGDIRKCLVVLTCLSSVYLIAPAAVTLHVEKQYIVIDNGIFQLTLSLPDGFVTGIKYGGIDNLLETRNKDGDRGYWDIVWNAPRGSFGQYKTSGRQYDIIQNDTKQVEVSFNTKWNASLGKHVVPMNTDLRYVVLDGVSGFYTYAIYERQQRWPDLSLGQNRMVFKLTKDKFHYMAISKERQRIMPMPDDREASRAQQLAYPEAVLLINPINPDLKGQVDDKYQYSSDKDSARVHGWVSSDPGVGFWMITPSDEFRTGGPFKQDLTSHVGPTTLAVFQSAHYVGPKAMPQFKNGEYWKKAFGPLFIYLNSATGPEAADPKALWNNAYDQMLAEVKQWPYAFPLSADYQKREQRGSVSGRILVRDKYINKDLINGADAYVGLALPGEVGSWQEEFKGYQFWTKADSQGNFVIPNVVAGVYDFYAYVPGFVGDYKLGSSINITSGCKIDLGDVIYEPPRDAPTLWEIGIPDRTAAEFFVPDPDPRYINKLYLNQTNNKYRQYGLWERYADLYPNGTDVVFTIGQSDYEKDWFFAQVTRKTRDGYSGTTWQVKFQLASVQPTGIYKLRIALASATYSELQVRFNDKAMERPHFTTLLIGDDNAIARHGIHGLHRLFNVDVKPTWLTQGTNTIFFTQDRDIQPFQGIMYDYIRMEGSIISVEPIRNNATINHPH